MPDTFKILHESFSEQPPVVDDEGFHDFNALSRISAAEETKSESESRHNAPREEVLPLNNEGGTPIQRQATIRTRSVVNEQPPKDAARLQQPLAEERRQFLSVKPAPQPVSTPSPSQAPAEPEVMLKHDQGWRQLSLTDLMSRIRNNTPIKTEGPRRLQGMFRR